MSNPNILNLDETERNRPTQARIKIKIPKKYHHEPIVSNLASRHDLNVNILAAMLGANARGDGWFDLQLSGSSQAIDSALIYLCELDIEIWKESDLERDGW
ncbi:ABC transporter [Candidatus Gracilibacteria bacterium]|jgi:ABC-type methionine transport system ATPase subunit|nr:ABC transporter [Candidatus Gracilibacteria bacterium]NJM85983.1 ABC transporter [Hydrococcus sp. RU_2_2]NJP17642.1 ABC transporter [Hydrococcus sp. CRU_1_1]